MSNSNLPDTESIHVTIAAIAWQIVNKVDRKNTYQTAHERDAEYTNAFLRVYQALKDGEPLNPEEKK